MPMRWSTLVALAVSTFLLSFPDAVARTLTFDERVQAQQTIERVYYAHQIGATGPFEEEVPRAVLEEKVRTYLKESVALETYWKTPITAQALVRELERMERNTRLPDRLREIYAALGNDRGLIRECLARPALADRLARNYFAFDQRMHQAERLEAADLHARLRSGALSIEADHPRRAVSGFEKTAAGHTGRRNLPAIDDASRTRMGVPGEIGAIGAVTEEREALRVSVVLRESSRDLSVAIYTVPKKSWDEWWSETAPSLNEAAIAPRPGAQGVYHEGVITTPACVPGDTWSNGILDDVPDPRSLHTLVWTGSEMIVWGGRNQATPLNSGGRYDPDTDTWRKVSTAGAPTPRQGQTAVWTGSRMIVWGGYGLGSPTGFLNSGGLYDPATDTWTPTSTVNAPVARYDHTAVWTGSAMIVWGGLLQSNTAGTGGRYDPITDTWSSTSVSGSPSARWQHTAVWTGSRMVVWGGLSGLNSLSAFLGDGAQYDPGTDTWSPTSMDHAPSVRSQHSAVWTGSEMIVWGGGGSGFVLQTGARYNPGTDTWTPTANGPAGRAAHASVWTGTEMLIWGGHGSGSPIDPGGRYDPGTDSWSPITAINAPPNTDGPAVWTGTRMIAWGGSTLSPGGAYDPATDSWTPTSTGNAPPGPYAHSAVWSGTQMIVWGGGGMDGSGINSGGRYDPVTDTWTATSMINAPEGRQSHAAVWTGAEMIVWGGHSNDRFLNTGGRYNPITDTWISTSVTNAPSPRNAPAVWTGTEMIVWSGWNGRLTPFNTGGRYNPVADSWVSTSTTNAPIGRFNHAVAWTGTRMIVWGGYNIGGAGDLNSGGQYDPAMDTWRPTSTFGAPPAREYPTAIWTGSRLVVWGGQTRDGFELNSGGRYDPGTDTWSPTTMTNAPREGYMHTAVWTGSRMIVWIGDLFFTSGGLYDPAADVWSPISITNAPSPRYSHTAVWTGNEMIVWGGTGDASNSYYLSGGRYSPDARYDPPVVDAGPDFAQECAAVDGTDVPLHGTAAGCGPLTYTWTGPFAEGGGMMIGIDAVVTLPLGQSPLMLKVEDAHGQSAADSLLITVRDSTPPTLAVQADPPVLWPPNHGLVPVTVGGEAQDVCDPSPVVTLVSVTSSEPDDAPGTADGATTGDVAGASLGTLDTELGLRAERNGSGPGRTYQLTYRAVDASGNATTALTIVTVPHDQGHGPEPLIMQLAPDGISGMARLYWSAIPDAVGYDVIVGQLEQARVENGALMLGPVKMLVRGITATSVDESVGGMIPETGKALFYLIQSRSAQGGSGYGTESAPWPRVPSSCDGGCD